MSPVIPEEVRKNLPDPSKIPTGAIVGAATLSILTLIASINMMVRNNAVLEFDQTAQSDFVSVDKYSYDFLIKTKEEQSNDCMADWTIGVNNEIFRNGISAAKGVAGIAFSPIFNCIGTTLYVRGEDGNYWKWNGEFWDWGGDDPEDKMTGYPEARVLQEVNCMRAEDSPIPPNNEIFLCRAPFKQVLDLGFSVFTIAVRSRAISAINGKEFTSVSSEYISYPSSTQSSTQPQTAVRVVE